MTGPIVSFAWTTDAYLANLKDATRRMWNDDYARRFRPGVEFQSWNKSPRFGGTYIDQAVVVVCEREPLIRLLEDRDRLRGLLRESLLILAIQGGSFWEKEMTYPSDAEFEEARRKPYPPTKRRFRRRVAPRGTPRIVCLCGSTRFYREFQEANYRETMKGRIVLSVGFYPHAEADAHGESTGITPEEKVGLDRLHFRKIELADEVLVLNKNGYVGYSTGREIEHARRLGKPIRWLEAPPNKKGGVMPKKKKCKENRCSLEEDKRHE